MIVTDFITKLTNYGWQIKLKNEPSFNSNVLQTRYGSIPDSYKEFLTKIVYCRNPDDDIWFLSEEDFEGKGDSDFAWNEFELQSLEAVREDNQEFARISNFWKTHIPILISVKGYYSYLAISNKENEKGVIVQGNEPEYEEVSKVCISFDELMDKITQKLNNNRDFYFSELI